MTEDASSAKPLDVSPCLPAEEKLPLISTRELFKQHSMLRIEHQGQLYLLRITRANKLILTK